MWLFPSGWWLLCSSCVQVVRCPPFAFVLLFPLSDSFTHAHRHPPPLSLSLPLSLLSPISLPLRSGRPSPSDLSEDALLRGHLLRASCGGIAAHGRRSAQQRTPAPRWSRSLNERERVRERSAAAGLAAVAAGREGVTKEGRGVARLPSLGALGLQRAAVRGAQVAARRAAGREREREREKGDKGRGERKGTCE